MIYTILKTTFIVIESKLLYRNYKNLSLDSISIKKKNLTENFISNCNSCDDFDHILDKPHVNKDLRSAIMKRSRLKSEANKTKSLDDIISYKKKKKPSS